MASDEHFEQETLFWTKAASILGMPQIRMPNSEVPIARRRARQMMLRLLRDNVGSWDGRLSSKQDIFAAWTALVGSSGEIFVEKSPHHLYQPAAIDLMKDYVRDCGDVDMRFIGLVRNPTATFYSSWRRFGIRPEVEERHWVRAYGLLDALQAEWPDRLSIVRYEDVTADKVDLASAAGLRGFGPFDYGFHRRSLRRWEQDSSFGYRPSAAVATLAARFGYSADDLQNPNAHDWRWESAPRAAAWRIYSSLPRPAKDWIRSIVGQRPRRP